MRAIWKGVTIAESADTVVVEGNHYFPRSSVRSEYLCESATRTTCNWKGEAGYYDLVVGDAINRDAAWYYAAPKPAAKQIAGHVAFWKGVQVVE
jgi:uncharacterized protein (DUF427 family)